MLVVFVAVFPILFCSGCLPVLLLSSLPLLSFSRSFVMSCLVLVTLLVMIWGVHV